MTCIMREVWYKVLNKHSGGSQKTAKRDFTEKKTWDLGAEGYIGVSPGAGQPGAQRRTACVKTRW